MLKSMSLPFMSHPYISLDFSEPLNEILHKDTKLCGNRCEVELFVTFYL